MVLGELLRWRAERDPESPFLRMQGASFTYGAFNLQANRLAHGLIDLGIVPGEVVSVMLPNCPEFMLSWFALAKAGAIESAINTAFRGPGLAHMLNISQSRVLISDETLLDPLAFIADDLQHVETLVLRGNPAMISGQFPKWRVIAFDEVASPQDSDPCVAVSDTQTAMLLFTSGTTGRSKACMLSHRFLIRVAALVAEYWDLQAHDVLYCPFPLFHADATYLTTLPGILRGSTVAIGERFSVSNFWAEVRQFGATVFDFMGSTLALLWKQPASPEDPHNPVRLAWGIPMPEWGAKFERRFGLKLVDGYGLTEAGVVVFRPLDESVPPGSCGKAVYPYDVRIVDEADEERQPGHIGEIVIRSHEPWMLFGGYYGMPEETLQTFRNLWFHTGDLAYKDEAGFFYFAGRKKDAIRRRGENVSAAEVEEIIQSHPAVLEAAAIGVPSDLSEEDIKVCVVLQSGADLSAEELIKWSRIRMSRFMIPRYVEFLDHLPKTPTEKVEKYRLLEKWHTPRTWDQEAVKHSRP